MITTREELIRILQGDAVLSLMEEWRGFTPGVASATQLADAILADRAGIQREQAPESATTANELSIGLGVGGIVEIGDKLLDAINLASNQGQTIWLLDAHGNRIAAIVPVGVAEAAGRSLDETFQGNQEMLRLPESSGERRTCPDGGVCHHECQGGCARVFVASPLSIAGWGDTWPAEVKRQAQEAETAWLGSPAGKGYDAGWKF